MKPASPLARLATDPERFGFDAAVRILLLTSRETDPGEVVRFRSLTGLAYPPADVLELNAKREGLPPDLIVSVMGLTGPSGVLPRSFSETVNTTLRSRSESLRDFLDMLSHRMVALFARAGTKYRPNRISEIGRLAAGDGVDRDNPLMGVLLSLTGYGTGHLVDRLAAGHDPLMHYAGFLTTQPRSAERLRALVSDWLGRPVEVCEFAGAWLPLPADQRTRLSGPGIAGQFHRLGAAPGEGDDAAGADATIGVRAWDQQAGIVLRIGPLDREDFTALLPDRPRLERLVALVRAYLGYATGFAINPIAVAAAVPDLQLRTDADPAPLLGWNTWMTAPAGSRTKHAAEAVFEAEVIEARVEARSRASERTAF